MPIATSVSFNLAKQILDDCTCPIGVIDVSNFDYGYYFLELTTDKGRIVTPFGDLK